MRSLTWLGSSVIKLRQSWRSWSIFALLVTLMVLAIHVLRQSDRDSKDIDCRSGLRSLGTALLQFGDFYGCLPPPFITDEAGRPLYSWRVLLLPSYSLYEPYDAFDFTKPWNEGVNQRLCEGRYNRILRNLFSCPLSDDSEGPYATYLYALSSDDIWPRDFFYGGDGSAFPGAILLVDVRERPVYWSEPVDLDYRDPGLEGLRIKLRRLRPVHRGGFNYFSSDGWVGGMAADRNPEEYPTDLGTCVRRTNNMEVLTERKMEALLARLTKAVRESAFHSRHIALLVLGELGPRGQAAVPLIREVVAGGEEKLKRVAVLALAKIERETRRNEGKGEGAR